MELFDHEVEGFLSMNQFVAACDVPNFIDRVVKNAEFVKQDVASLIEDFKVLENSSGPSHVGTEELFLFKLLVMESALYSTQGIPIDFQDFFIGKC